jgi:hypothetical protein
MSSNKPVCTLHTLAMPFPSSPSLFIRSHPIPSLRDNSYPPKFLTNPHKPPDQPAALLPRRPLRPTKRPLRSTRRRERLLCPTAAAAAVWRLSPAELQLRRSTAAGRLLPAPGPAHVLPAAAGIPATTGLLRWSRRRSECCGLGCWWALCGYYGCSGLLLLLGYFVLVVSSSRILVELGSVPV